MGANEAYQLARLAYNAYGRVRAWTAVDGSAMPAWSQQREDIQDAWVAAVVAVRLALEAGVTDAL